MFNFILTKLIQVVGDRMETETINPLLLNNSLDEMLNRINGVDPELYNQYVMNRAINEPAYTILIVMYCLLILMGALGNTLVIVAVFRKSTMRTPRNMFIVNLAVADLLLCTVTMPLTMMEILTKYFPLGNYLFVCKTIGMLQATSTYVSTISITAIALDRYQVIVYPTKESLQVFGAVFILLLIWLVAILLAMPLFIVRHLNHHELPGSADDALSLDFCIENWPIAHGRAYYSIFSLIFQYTLPIIIVSAAYYRISYRLRYRFQAGFVSTDDQRNRRQLRGRRLQKTNVLLSSIAIIFCISWLPLNLFNLIADLSPENNVKGQKVMVCYAICHMMGMSSACSNPVLYGCLNENFWKEFKDILCIEKSTDDAAAPSQRLSLRKKNQKNPIKPELVTDATNYQPCNTMSSDLSVLTKC